tara:strand:- start:158 stop:319 length:162 start_codon:yes stop_codon:yes gene_type:complete
MLNIKKGDLVLHKSKKVGVVINNLLGFDNSDWFFVLCEGRMKRWHISNIEIVN